MEVKIVETAIGKTVIENMNGICTVLDRDSCYFRKFIERQLGVSVDENGVCSSRVSQEEIQVCLRAFVRLFVKCSQCESMNTDIVVQIGKRRKKRNIQPSQVWIECHECSFDTPVFNETLAGYAFEKVTKTMEDLERPPAESQESEDVEIDSITEAMKKLTLD
jgi:translation initiation factor 2 beta subunit (eIF-2beta)/eIF-5